MTVMCCVVWFSGVVWGVMLPAHALDLRTTSKKVTQDELVAFKGWQTDDLAVFSALKKDIRITPITKQQFLAAKKNRVQQNTPLATKEKGRIRLICPKGELTFQDVAPDGADDSMTVFHHSATYPQANAFAVTVNYYEGWARWYFDRKTCTRVAKSMNHLYALSPDYMLGFDFDPYLAGEDGETGSSLEMMVTDNGSVLGTYTLNLPWVVMPNREENDIRLFQTKDGYLYFSVASSYWDKSGNETRDIRYARLNVIGHALKTRVKANNPAKKSTERRFYPVIYNYFDHPIEVRLGNQYIGVPACNINRKISYVADAVYEPVSIEDAETLFWRFDTQYAPAAPTNKIMSGYDFKREEDDRGLYYNYPYFSNLNEPHISRKHHTVMLIFIDKNTTDFYTSGSQKQDSAVITKEHQRSYQQHAKNERCTPDL